MKLTVLAALVVAILTIPLGGSEHAQAPVVHETSVAIAPPEATTTTTTTVAPEPAPAPPATDPGQPQGRQDNDTAAHPVVQVVVAPPAPVGPWDPPLTYPQPAAPIRITWTGPPGPSSPDGIDGYQCWGAYGAPIPQPKSQPYCPVGWGGRPPEHPLTVG